MEQRYYYKLKEGNGYLSVKTPLDEETAKNYVTITKEEFDASIPEPVAPTPEELRRQEIENQIALLKAELSKTDYKAIKYAEGWISEEDYAPIKAERQALRDRINELEEQLK